MKIEKKNSKKLKSQSINFPAELILAVAVYMQETGAKSISEAVCILTKKGLENVEYTDKLSKEVQEGILNFKNDLLKITSKILKGQEDADKNILDLKELYSKKEGSKKTKTGGKL